MLNLKEKPSGRFPDTVVSNTFVAAAAAGGSRKHHINGSAMPPSPLRLGDKTQNFVWDLDKLVHLHGL